MRGRTTSLSAYLCALFALVHSAAAWSQAAAPAAAASAASFPSDDNRFKGDHLRFPTNVDGFVAQPEVANATARCAPAGSRVAISDEDDANVYVRFLSVTDEGDTVLYAADKLALAACPASRRVNTFTPYRLPRTTLTHLDYKRSGVSFGGLMVPFKYRLGSGKQLISSSTFAPFVGFRTGWLQDWGLTFTPVMAAGLSLVPVADADGKSTSAKSAYTFALGFRMTSSKNENFSAGLLYGRDFLSKADRDADPTVKKPWLSFYVGASM